MSTTFHQRLLTALLAALSLAAFPAISHAEHSWGSYHWARASNSFTLKLHDNVSAAWEESLLTAQLDWSLSEVLNIEIDRSRASDPRKCRPTSGRVEVCNTTYGKNGWLGVASIWISLSHITQGTVKLNDSYFNTEKYGTSAWRNLVMCQEVGHTYGLDHQDETFSNPNLGTCMDYTNDPSTNQHPNQHDYDQLVTIYGHLDNSTTVSQTIQSGPGKGKMPPAMRDIEISGPGQWGKLIHSSHGGWKETYELDFGGGHKIITHVIWATDEDDDADHDHDHGRR